MTVHGKHVEDRRIQKTQKLLREALVSLMHEKPYDAIAVTEILDRANVGRSTFYTHFHDKDDLLANGIHDMIRAVRSAPRSTSANGPESTIWFSLAIFERHEQHRRTGEAGMGARGRAIMHEHLRRLLAEVIAEDVRKGYRRRRKADERISSDLLAEYIASTFVLVLNWWVETGSLLSPNEVNNLFRALVVPTLAAAWHE